MVIFCTEIAKILLDKRLTKFLYTFKNNDYKKIAINSMNKEKKRKNRISNSFSELIIILLRRIS